MYQIPQRRRLSKDSKWVTISDLKIQAVKEICYEVALNDFRHSRQEIEALAIVKMKELCAMYGKKDPNERDSWRAVSRDVWDTVGVGDERIEDVISLGKGVTDVDDLKVHVDKLEDILQEVKNQNNTKDEEIRALRNKMLKMERVLPLIGSQDQKIQSATAGHRVRDLNGENTLMSSSLGPEDEQDKGDGAEPEKEVRVTKLMEDDPLFRRGRLQWMRQEQVKFKNLQQQEITKQLRRQTTSHRFIPPENRKPRFPFKSNPSHRNSWSPGTHIIITEKDVIEVKIPREVEEGPDEENERHRGKSGSGEAYEVWSPFSQMRNQQYKQQQYRKQDTPPPQRWRSNSLNNGSQRGLRRQTSGSSESLQSPDNYQTPDPYHQQRPQASQHHHAFNGYNQRVSSDETSNYHDNQADRAIRYNPFVTPPRMRRQYSAPNLKSGRETTV